MKKQGWIMLSVLVLGMLLCNLSTKAQSGRPSSKNPLATASSRPANASNSTAPEDDDVVTRVRTNEVILPVTVRNDYGGLSNNLSVHDFIVIEDGTRQEITSFNARRVPLKVAILLDVSGSVFSEMEAIRKASVEFVQQLAPGDEACVIQFGKGVELLQDWTADRNKIEHALQWRYRPDKTNYTETHLWDALFLAADELLSKVEGRRTILVLTDGDDNNSKVVDTQALGAILRANTSLYVISKARAIAEDIKHKYGGIGGAIVGTRGQANTLYRRLMDDEARMDEMATRTGGKLYSPLKSEDMADAYRQIGQELQTQYILTYISTNEEKPATYRKISVVVTRPGLKANTREGYYVK